MTRIIILVFLLPLFACNNNQGTTAASKKMHDEIMEVHDEVMPKMSDIRKLSKKLRNVEDSESNKDIQDRIDELGAAHESMMEWMAQYKMPKDITETEEMEFLKKQKVSVNEMKEQLLTAIRNAELELSKHTEQ